MIPRLPSARRLHLPRMALLVSALLGAAPMPLFGQPGAAHDPVTVAVTSSSTHLNAVQLPAGDGGTVTTRAVRQRIGFHAASPDQRVRSGVLVGYVYDAGLPAEPRHPLLLERQLDPSLETAWIAFRALPSLDLKAGRFVTDTFAWEKLDGAALQLLPTRRISIELAGGSRPGQQTTSLNGDRADRGAEGALLRERPPGLLLGSLVRYRSHRVSAFAAWTDERLPTRSQLLRRALRGGGSVGTPDGPSARFETTVEAIRWQVAAARGVVRVPLQDVGSIDLSGRFDRPVFALDSVFGAFPTLPGARVDLAFRRDRPARFWRISTGTRIVPQIVALAGFSTRAHLRTHTLDVRTDAELGARRAATSVVALFRAAVTRTVALEPTLSAHVFRDRSGRDGNDWTGTVRAAQGVRLDMGRASTGWARVDGGWDSVVGFSWRVLAQVDVHLPAWRRQRGA